MYHALTSPKRAQIVQKFCHHNRTRPPVHQKRFVSNHNEGELPWQSHLKIQRELELVEIQKQYQHYQKNFVEPEKKANYNAQYSTLLGPFRAEAIAEAEEWRRKLVASQDAVESLREFENLQQEQNRRERGPKIENKKSSIRNLLSSFRKYVLETKIPFMIDIPKQTLEPEKWQKPPVDWNLVVETLNEQLGLYNKKFLEDLKHEEPPKGEELDSMLEAIEELIDARFETFDEMKRTRAEEKENDVAEALAQRSEKERTDKQAQPVQEQLIIEEKQPSEEEMLKLRAKKIQKRIEAEIKEAERKKKLKEAAEKRKNQEQEEFQEEQEYEIPTEASRGNKGTVYLGLEENEIEKTEQEIDSSDAKSPSLDKNVEKLIPKEIGSEPEHKARYAEQLIKVQQMEKEIAEKTRTQDYVAKAFEQLGIDFHSQTEHVTHETVKQHPQQVEKTEATENEQPNQQHIQQPRQYKAIEIRILEDTNVREFVASQTFLNPHKASFDEDRIPMEYDEDKSHMQPFGKVVSEKRLVKPKTHIVEEPRNRWEFMKLLLQGEKGIQNPIFPQDEEPLPKASIIPRKLRSSDQTTTIQKPSDKLFENKFETPPITLPEHRVLIPQREAVISEHYATAAKLADSMKQDDLKYLEQERDKLKQIQQDIEKQIAESKKKKEMEIASATESLLKQQAGAHVKTQETETDQDETPKSDKNEGEEQKEPEKATPLSLLQRQQEQETKKQTAPGLFRRIFNWDRLTGVPKLDPAKLFQYKSYPLGGPFDFYRTTYDENFQKHMKFWFLKYDSLVDFHERTGVNFKELKHTLRHQIIPELLNSISARDYEKILHYVDDRVLLKWDNDNRWQVPAGITQHSKVFSVGALRMREFLYDPGLPMAWMKLTFRVLRNRFWMQNGWIIRGEPERLLIDSYAIKLCVVFPEAEDPLIPLPYSQPRWIVTGLMPRGKRLWRDKPPRRKRRRRRMARSRKRFLGERREFLSQFKLNKSLRLFETEEGPVVSDMNAWQRQYQLNPPIHYLYRRFTKASKLGKLDDTLKKMLFPPLQESQNEIVQTQQTQRGLYWVQQKTPGESRSVQPTVPSSASPQNIPSPTVSSNPILSDPLTYTIYEEKRVAEEVKKIKEEVAEYYKKVVDRIFQKRHSLVDPTLEEEEAQATIADIPVPPYLAKYTKQPLDVKKVALLLNRMHVIIHKQPFVNETFLTTMLSIHQQHRGRRKEKKEQNLYKNLHLKWDPKQIRTFNPEIMSKIRRVAREKAYEDLVKEEQKLVEKRIELEKSNPLSSFEIKKQEIPKPTKFEPYKPGSLFSVTKEGLLERQNEFYKFPRYGTTEAFVIRNKPKPNFQTEFWKKMENTRIGPAPWWRPVAKQLETNDAMPMEQMEDEGYSYHIRDWKRIVDQAKRTRQKQ